MRTEQEIIDRINAIESEDWMGFERNDLISVLPFEAAKPFLKEGVTEEEWEPVKEDPVEGIKDYMDFAWSKANNNRGISAYRNLCHMRAWLWLAEKDDFLSKVDLMEYSHYGKPQLRAVCELLNIDWKQYDDGRWTNEELADGGGPDDVPRIEWE